MESAGQAFGGLKRRTTDLVNNMSKPTMPSMPAMPAMPSEFPKLTDLTSKLPKLPSWGGGAHAHPTKPTVKGTWERIDVPAIPRSSHSLNIVAGNAYIFGGEIEPRKPVDNDMHVIVLPYSSANADYYTVKPKPAPKPEKPQIPTVVEPTDDDEDKEKGKEKDLSDVNLASPEGEDAAPVASASGNSALAEVPEPRVGHATAVIGNRIFLFGGRGGPDMQPLEENGRVWVFDTKTHLWSYLDPYLPSTEPTTPSFADKRQHYPAARSYHSAVGVDQPRDFGGAVPRGSEPVVGGGPGKKLRRTPTWSEWAQGDSERVGTPQQPIVGNIASTSRDEDDDGYGTFIVVGGCFAEGRANDVWAFDVRSRVWQELPSAPGKPRGGTSIAVAAGKLWRFGGFNGEGEEGGQLDYLELGVDNLGDRTGDVLLAARGEWKSIVALSSAAAPADDEGKPLAAEAEQPYWPGNRSVAGLQTITVGGMGGREYLLLALGERDPSNDGHNAAGKFWEDIWAYELPRRATAAGAMIGAVFGQTAAAAGTTAAEGKWFRVETEAYDDDDPYAAKGAGPRGWFASGHMGELEERGLVIWGGIDGSNKRLGDGWILRFGDEKREA